MAAMVTDFKPSLISWNLTKKCNLRCPHCYLDAGRGSETELTTRDCLGLLDEMRALGTEMVILTGGEPLLRKDVFDIARHASELGMWVVMGTNGVLITDRVAGRMVECGVKGVGISLDSIVPEKHDRFRGAAGSWKHSVRALEICRSHGLEVLVQTTVMDMNHTEIPDLAAFARKHGAWSLNLYFLVQTGRGMTMNDLPAERTADLLSDLVGMQDQYRPMLIRSKCAPQFKQIAYQAGRGGMESGGCMAGTQYARITPEGDVTPCPYMDAVAGNLRKEGFTRIWETSPLLQDLRDPDRLRGRCGRCEFRELCGGCRCRAYASTGDYLQEDPACTYVPTGSALETPALVWSKEAERRLDRIPITFIRKKTREGVEAYARRTGVSLVTPEVLKRALSGGERPAAFGRLPDFGSRNENTGTGSGEQIDKA